MRNIKNLPVTLLAFFFCFHAANAQTPAQNKAGCESFYAAFNGDISKFDASKFVTADFMDYSVPPEAWQQMGSNGVARFQASISSFKNAFPDIHVKTLKSVAEGNTVMVFIEMTGTFKNDFMGMKATGKSFKITDVDIIEFNAMGKATAHWAVQDAMVMWTQLGVEMK